MTSTSRSPALPARRRARARHRRPRRARRGRGPTPLPAARADDQISALQARALGQGCPGRRRAPAGRRARAAQPRCGCAAHWAARGPRPTVAARWPRRAPRGRPRAHRLVGGTARIRPPSRRTALSPSRCPPGSTSGPPEEPRGSGAVCSIEPPMRRPPGPRGLRPVAEIRPKVTRRPRPLGSASASTGAPCASASTAPAPRHRGRVAGLHRHHREVDVGAGRAASAVRVTENVTATAAAQHVRARQDEPVLDHDARPAPPRPSPTTDGPTSSATFRTVSCNSRSDLLIASHYTHDNKGTGPLGLLGGQEQARPRRLPSPMRSTVGNRRTHPRRGRAARRVRDGPTSSRRSSRGLRPTCSARG